MDEVHGGEGVHGPGDHVLYFNSLYIMLFPLLHSNCKQDYSDRLILEKVCTLVNLNITLVRLNITSVSLNNTLVSQFRVNSHS